MALTNDIQLNLMRFVNGGYYDIIIPNFFYGTNECDLFRINATDFVYEYEIKISRSDYFNDFQKNGRDEPKHATLSAGIGDTCPNRFFYVVPDGLINIDEVPKYAGLIYWHGQKKWFSIIKNASLIHKRKIGLETYRDVCRTLANRDKGWRKRIREIRNTDFDKEMGKMKREVDRVKQENKDLTMQILHERRHGRKATA